MRRSLIALVASTLALSLASGAGATDVPIPGGLGLTRTDPVTGAGNLVKLVARRGRKEAPFPVPPPGGPDDPRAVGGSFLRCTCTGGLGSACVPTPGLWTPIPLAPSGWRPIGSSGAGWRYRGAGTAADPCRLVVVRSRLVRAICRGPSAVDPLFEQPVVHAVADELRIGSFRYCAQWLFSFRRNDFITWKDRRQAAPDGCPSLEATPSPSPTPTPTPPYGSPSAAFLAPQARLVARLVE